MVSLVGVTPRCALHPEVEAGGTCQRCGGFVCEECSTWVMGVLYCAACSLRPEVNYLETFRLKLWGRRDTNAWLVGVGTLAVLAGVLTALLQGVWPMALVLLGAAVVGGAFYLGQHWARTALVFTPVVAGVAGAAMFGPALLVGGFLLFVTALQIFLDTRNRLFFRVDVSEKELRRLWDLRVNNPMARHALSLGFTTFIFPVLGPVAVVFGLIALRKVDSRARPPIGKGWQAVAGILLGVGGTVLWLLLFGPLMKGFLERLPA
ncbi:MULTISPECIES: DUF4190 domain-containing protein [unclassified Myxococcus]|uniref:DUF4190 domain-containing protein n=1 Tax=unclassified Myxococcus TaxID=2648731 RepID=UPI00157AB7AF|nr:MULTISPECIES: DUF4190 domain-containing protein [unclassified Myxococcus]NTX38187.1 DUF4190 domain-containing protein [Myxococcus sp. CA033]NTX58186.1 DUF4190 domain-containing protein [Myxococcus sp. CA039A]